MPTDSLNEILGPDALGVAADHLAERRGETPEAYLLRLVRQDVESAGGFGAIAEAILAVTPPGDPEPETVRLLEDATSDQ